MDGTGNGYVELKWAKLEIGEAATPFVSPHPATELAKCQRYYYRLTREKYLNLFGYSEFGNGITAYIFLPVSMRIRPTVTSSNIYAQQNNSAHVPTITKEQMLISNDNRVVNYSIIFTDPVLEKGFSTLHYRDSSYIEFSADL